MITEGIVRAIPFEKKSVLPEKADVVMIGGGINGVLTTYWLTLRGYKVVLVEKGEIAGESSSQAFGWISDLMLDPVKMEMTGHSKPLWALLQRSMGEVGYRRHGVTFWAHTAGELAYYRAWMTKAGVESRSDIQLLDAEQTKAMFPGLQEPIMGALHSSSDRGGEPRVATVAIAMAAAEAGATFVTRCAARGLEIVGDEVKGVHTEHGLIRCDRTVFAGNYWSRLFCGNVGVDVPQLHVISSLWRTAPIKHGPPGAGGS